ncbi:MAG TPA: S8 family serine peptidase, partial [Pseudonocardiaceae bacterium]
ATATAAPAAAEPRIADAGGATAIAGSYIVVFDDKAVSAQGVDALTTDLAKAHGATVEHRYSAALRGFAGSMSEAAAKRIAAEPGVAYVAQNHSVGIAADQLNPPSWGLDRVDQQHLPLNQRYSYSTTASNITAYILDTGIRTTHQDFGGRATWGTNTTGDGNNTDCHGHGTHVAGTVGGGAYGVAKGVRLVAVKVLNCAGSGTTAGVVAGVDWVTANSPGPSVANMSLGGGVQTALDTAVANSIASGVTYAIASGNSYGADACNFSPARVGTALTVNASDIGDNRASFSNIGACTDLFGPGVNITSAWSTSDTATSTISGTSMATPHVAGAAALYLSGNTGATPAQVHAHIVNTATPNKIPSPGANTPNRLLFTGSSTPPPPADDTLTRGQALEVGQFRRSANGVYTLVMQGDGNLVQYNSAGAALWHTSTHGSGAVRAVMQYDGNFVLYRADGTAVWHTGTHGTAADRLVVQDDANIVIYGPNGQVFWHTR